MSPDAGLVTPPAVVVGVDSSEQNEAAVEYGLAEAIAQARALLLVTVIDADPALNRADALAALATATLDERRNRIAAAHEGLAVSTEVRFGHPVGTLLACTGDDDQLVVGKRGLGAVRRLLVGSTSIRAAGWSPVPVTVVPGGWDTEERATSPVVLGIDPDREHGAAVRFAFGRAHRCGAGIRVVYAADMEAILVVGAAAVTAADLHDWEPRSVAALEAELTAVRRDYPDVPVEIVPHRGHAATVLQEQSAGAQLLVLSRRRRGHAAWGLGSVAREVLHGAELPVAIVPSRD